MKIRRFPPLQSARHAPFHTWSWCSCGPKAGAVAAAAEEQEAPWARAESSWAGRFATGCAGLAADGGCATGPGLRYTVSSCPSSGERWSSDSWRR